MSDAPSPAPTPEETPKAHRRRPRYSGKNPRRFDEKYKEHNPEKYAETIAKVMASGKTPAGMHRPIMVDEIMDVLIPQPGHVAVDCTLGYGGHTKEILARIQPGGRLLGLDADPIELPKTEERLRDLGFDADTFTAHRSNYAGLPQVLAAQQLTGADMILADLGVSSMQLDDPSRGFSIKNDGPLDMRMNPHRGLSAASYLEKISSEKLAVVLVENADEPYSDTLSQALAGKQLTTTQQLAKAIRAALIRVPVAEHDLSVRRTFQALRIAVNEEFTALDTLLRHLPFCLNPGGRAAILTFHSGEDRRVKKSFEAGLQSGLYSEIAQEVLRPSKEEQHDNLRSRSAKLRWAKRVS